MCSTTLSSPYSVPDTIPGVEDKQPIDKNSWPHGTSFLGDRHWAAITNLEGVGGVGGGSWGWRHVEHVLERDVAMGWGLTILRRKNRLGEKGSSAGGQSGSGLSGE